MTGDEVPPAIRQFLLESIDSVAQLEALLLLRQDPHQVWSGDLLARRLYIGPSAAVEVLAALCARGLLSCDTDGAQTYCYAPDSRERAELVNWLADVYKQRLVAITHLIHSKPASSIQQFADAFRLWKDSER